MVGSFLGTIVFELRGQRGQIPLRWKGKMSEDTGWGGAAS